MVFIQHRPSSLFLPPCRPQDEFEVSRGLCVSAAQVVEALTPLMTPERVHRIRQASDIVLYAVCVIVCVCVPRGTVAVLVARGGEEAG